MQQKSGETVDSLEIKLMNLIDLCKYPECSIELFMVKTFKHAVKHFEVHHLACE